MASTIHPIPNIDSLPLAEAAAEHAESLERELGEPVAITYAFSNGLTLTYAQRDGRVLVAESTRKES